ncbi:exopolysaccharide biosynthesis polyprenyl glycosylphosphotransferase [Gaiella occulta]|uniref:Exopolysaccharide biosynthesis polyprenyl glycosylphosphotransferase n=1 Tax=Gaiella occulta TaxID=1002870 RepID=A0A7M2YVX2_9ACTN|nr:sugar transferase [Gaiella occulta]RDI74291.1 exopolysaccharide biosynthesis polyprenyl glycosylphosphotransferase [Gaiella occulta]
MPTKAAPPAPTERPEPAPESPAAADARSSRIYILSRGPLLTLVRRLFSVVSLAALDVVGLALGIYIALVLRSFLYGKPVFWALLWREGPAQWLKFLAPVCLLVFFQAGLYASRERRPGSGRVVSSLVLVALIVLAFGLGTSYDFTTTGLIPTAVVTCAIMIGLLRAAYESLSLELMKLSGIRRRVVLAGAGESLRRLQRELGASRGGIAYDLVGAVSAAAETGLPQLGTSLDDIPAVLERERPDELILTESDFDERTVLDVVERAHRAGVRVRLAPNTTELLVQKGEYVPGTGVPLFELRPPILTGWDWALKRAFDLIAGATVAVVGLPLWLLIAAAIKLDSHGPVLYVDRRVGVGEREFGMLKFRTMVEDAAARQSELEQLNEASGALFKIRDDPRVTRVGRVLRRLSLDELPQLVNVLRGQMSLVGPRPLPLRDYERLQDWHRARYRVLPGMTGLWQISGRSGLSFDDLVRLDFTYLENWSVWLDISIIVKTIPAVLSRRGAY